MRDRTVLVTGASSGLGRAIAQYLAEGGARVILIARDRQRLQDTAASLPGGPHLFESFDLAQPDSLPAWIKAKTVEWGALHGVVHSAGLMPMRPLRMINAADWDAVMRTNVAAASALAKAFRQPTVNFGGGSIVFLSSVTGLVGQPAQSLYGASKGALIAMARSLAIELAPEKIRVNCVAPGVVEAGMSDRIKQSVTPEQWARITAQHPLGLGRPEDVAHAVAFLLSDASRWITGTTLVVDGGYTAQ